LVNQPQPEYSGTAQIAPGTDSQKIEAALNLYTLGAPWSTATADPHLASVAVKGENTGGEDQSGTRTYTVKSGDTLSGIATTYHLKTASLLVANPDLQQASLIQTGQQLVIPEKDASSDQLAAVAKKVTVHLASVSSSTIPTSGSYTRPVAYQYISQDFSGAHPGLDLVAPYGTPIYAAKAGCINVMSGGWSGGYGNHIDEDLGGGYMARYAHMETFAEGLQVGSCVNAGDLLGYVGLTGRTTGPHLHFELRYQGTPIRPPFH